MIKSSRLPMKTTFIALAAVALLAGCGKNKGKVYFGNLADGAEVQSPFTVEMRAENLVVEPAASGVRDGHGHFHILVNTPMPRSMDPIPNDAQHIHYGEGQTEAVLDLPVGEHTLILQFAQGDHRPYDPQIAQEIRVRVTHRDAPADAEGMNGSGAMGANGTNGVNGSRGANGEGLGAGRQADSARPSADPGTHSTPAAPSVGPGSSGNIGTGGM